MTRQDYHDLSALASLVAEVIHRLGPAYGSHEVRTHAFTMAVKISQRAYDQATKEEPC